MCVYIYIFQEQGSAIFKHFFLYIEISVLTINTLKICMTCPSPFARAAEASLHQSRNLWLLQRPILRLQKSFWNILALWVPQDAADWPWLEGASTARVLCH